MEAGIHGMESDPPESPDLGGSKGCCTGVRQEDDPCSITEINIEINIKEPALSQGRKACCDSAGFSSFLRRDHCRFFIFPAL